MIDTHSHIYGEEFDADRDQVIARAKQTGVESIILANCDRESLARIIDSCEKYPDYCYPTVGLHPGSVDNNYKEELAYLKSRLSEVKAVAVGEIGLDLYWDKTYINEQIDAFEQQIEWSIEHNLPLIIHVRDAFAELHASLSKYKGRGLRGVIHSFSGTAEDAEKIFTYGNFFLGINGTITYKKSNHPTELKLVGADRLVIETDSPYFTPVPCRRKRNESVYVKYTAKKLSEIFETDIDKILKITTDNAKNLFLGMI